MNEASDSLPAGLLIHGSPADLAGDFAGVAELQPMEWTGRGLLCAPRAAADVRRAGAALAALAHPHEPVETVPGWPDPPAGWVGGWYRRSVAHAPAPPGVRELIQTPGEGFGAAGHPTTGLCLSLLAHLPAGPALDAGCGAGLLTQAWRALGRGSVLALDLDGRAIRHAGASLNAAGLADGVELRRGALGALRPEDLGGRVLLANIPAGAHRELLPRIGPGTGAALIAGPGPEEFDAVVDAYRERGLHERARADDGRWRAMIVTAS